MTDQRLSRQVIGLFGLKDLLGRDEYKNTIKKIELDYKVRIERNEGTMDYIVSGWEDWGLERAYVDYLDDWQ